MPGLTNTDLDKIVDHLFRHEAGRMVAVLTRMFGFPNMEQAEDIVQDTILRALETWKYGRIPDNPQAWLYRVAKNQAIDIIRRQKVKWKVENELSSMLRSEYTLSATVNEMFTENEIKDSQLRMMFACYHPAISLEAQITLMLKTLCGLSVHEIANAFLTNGETIQKRLYRTKEKLRSENIALIYPGKDEMPERTEAVLKALYLLFNEGYNSSDTEQLIREDLCEEAMRLTILLTENTRTDLPQTNALLALMCYHASRFDSRLDGNGSIVLLKDQDRSLWNRPLIMQGNMYLTRAAEGTSVHEYHLEASIASIHANAFSNTEVDWPLILQLYNTLYDRTDNPVVAINRCLVIAEVNGPAEALRELTKMKGMEGNLAYNASLGELYLRNGNRAEARNFLNKALSLTASNAERELIGKKIDLCS